jgi:hypothetical protein
MSDTVKVHHIIYLNQGQNCSGVEPDLKHVSSKSRSHSEAIILPFSTVGHHIAHIISELGGESQDTGGHPVSRIYYESHP